MRSAFLVLVTALGLGALSQPARADVISGSYSFSATLIGTNDTPPFFFGPFVNNPATGMIDIAFDNATDIPESTAGVSARDLNFTLGSPLSFTYVKLLDLLTVGGSFATAAVVSPGTNDFSLVISNASSNPAGLLFSLSQLSPVFSGLSGVSVGFTAVPEPATLALFGVGLAGLLVSRARRRA